MLIDHTRREPSSMITNAELSAAKVSVQSTVYLYWYKKCQTTYGSMTVCSYQVDHCNSHRTCEMLTSDETVEIPVTSICLSVVFPDSKTYRM
jgi:hypothetical protein